MHIDFNYGISDAPGQFSAYVEWVDGIEWNRKSAYETASSVVETLICWKGWPHLDAQAPLPRNGWTYTMDTFEAHGAGPDMHLFTVVFENMLDQLQFVSWWDTHSLHAEAEAESDVAEADDGVQPDPDAPSPLVDLDAIAVELDRYVASHS